MQRLRIPKVAPTALFALCGLYVAFFLALNFLNAPSVITSLTFLPIEVVAVCACLVAARRARHSRRLRRAWYLVTAGLAAQTGGAVTQLISEHITHTATYPSISDFLYLSFYPLLLAGVLSFPSVRRNARQTVELVLDCAIVAVSGSAVVVYFVIGADATEARPLEAAVTIAYPVADMLLLVGLATALLRTPLPHTRSVLHWIAGAMGLFVVADLIWGYLVLHGSYEGGHPIDAFYLVAFMCFAIAAARNAIPPIADAPYPRLVSSRANWLPYLAVAACLSILVVEELPEGDFHHFGVVVAVVAVTALIGARQLFALGEARRSESRLSEAQELASVGSWNWDVEHDRLEFSEVGAKIGGLQADSIFRKDEAIQVVHPDDREEFDQVLEASVSSGRPFVAETRVYRDDGELRTLLVRGEIERRGERTVQMRGTHQDITERKEMERRLRYQAEHDPLTGLYNRRRFGEELERALAYAARYGRPGAVLMFDVDNFKFINDSRGHAAGDATLNAVARTIERRARKTDIVARLGGDEFALVLLDTSEEDAVATADEIRAKLNAANGVAATRLSVGIAPFRRGNESSAADLLIAADVALYEAKELGRDQVRVYGGSATIAMSWVDRISTALSEDRFVLFAQPLIDIESGEVTHRELLIRMVSEEGELIPPADFLPTAERFGLITEIDRWVVSQALELARKGEKVNVNLSAASIGDEEILSLVRKGIARGARPEDLIFEITETAAMTNMDAAREFATTLGNLGCSLALDDFGTGFGSFGYLKHLPTRFLKIDMEFVRDMVTNTADREVVKAITEVAHSLGKETVAEGVEDEATLESLREYGVDWAQGFYIGRPERVSRLTAVERGEGQPRREGSGAPPGKSLMSLR